jgi:enoyl-CoA hydratase
MQTHVSWEQMGDVGYLTLACDEPGKPATLDVQVLDELAAHMQSIQTQMSTLRAVVLQSSSTKYFCVGANIRALQTLDAGTIVPWIQKGHAVFNQLESLALPVIARVEGYALGGGLEMAMACDLIVASREAKFGQPEANLGLIAGWGGTFRLPRRIGLAQAKELLYTGKIIDATAAHEIGLVNFVGDRVALDAHVESLLADIRRCSAVAIAQTKKLVNRALDIGLQECLSAEVEASSACIATKDTQARVTNYLDSRKKT